jgi:SAM-dependent methyltransferase
MALEPNPPKDSTVRIVKSGAFLGLSEDPVERYQYHFAQLIERSLKVVERPMTALDFACGTGLPSLTLIAHLPAESRIIALSDSRADLQTFHHHIPATRRPYIFPRKERRDHLPFASGVFDVAWAALSGEELQPLGTILSQVLRVLRPGAQLLISAPLRATFAELANAISPSLAGYQNHPAFAALLSQPPHLLGSQDWLSALQRCGAMEINIERARLELAIAPPLSSQPLFVRHLLPLWLGDDPALQAEAVSLLDQTVHETLDVTIHVGCLASRRGLSKTPS